jgi:hypothetical protein
MKTLYNKYINSHYRLQHIHFFISKFRNRLGQAPFLNYLELDQAHFDFQPKFRFEGPSIRREAVFCTECGKVR